MVHHYGLIMRKTVKVYTPLVRYEKILFAIQDFVLPVPVSYRQIGFFVSAYVFMFILVHLPLFNFMQEAWGLNYVVIPVAAAWFFTKFKLDGKAPHRFIWDYCLFLSSSAIYNRYEKAKKPEKYRYKTAVTYRKGDDTE